MAIGPMFVHKPLKILNDAKPLDTNILNNYRTKAECSKSPSLYLNAS